MLRSSFPSIGRVGRREFTGENPGSGRLQEEGCFVMAPACVNRFRSGLSKALARPASRCSPQRLRGVEVLESRELLATFTVTNLHNSGAGSLRQAIIESNKQPGADTIDFDVAGTIRIGRTLAPRDHQHRDHRRHLGPVVRRVAGRHRELPGFQGTPIRQRLRRIEPQVALAGEGRQRGRHAHRLERHGPGQLYRPAWPTARPSPATAGTACGSMPRRTAT